MIPYGRQNISQDDIQAVTDVLQSDFLTQGPVIPEFEKKISQYCGAQYAIATNSATSALHIACLSLGLGAGDILWTSPITFVASANCALYCGANVDFVDIDPNTYNISINALQQKLELAKKNNSLPKILVAVHFAGTSCDMSAISELAARYKFNIIEDASHAIGAKYNGRPVGSCQYSDISVFSFHPVKIITTGEGGIATTNNPELHKKMDLLRTHGVTRDRGQMHSEPDGGWYYEQIELGFNYRMSDIHAALGLSQLTRLNRFIEERNSIAVYYRDKLKNSSVIAIPEVRGNILSSYHLYVVRVDKKVRRDVFESMRNKGIGVNVHYIPVYKHPYYQQYNFNEADFPEAERYYQEAITLPIFPGLSYQELDYICDTLLEVLY